VSKRKKKPKRKGSAVNNMCVIKQDVGCESRLWTLKKNADWTDIRDPWSVFTYWTKRAMHV